MDVTHLYLELTSACNLSCTHCCLGKRPLAELQHVGQLLDAFSKKGGKYITLSGGEPLLRKDWADISAYSSQLGFTTTIFTNGTLVKENLSSLVDLNVKVALSIDGVDEAANQALRKNSYQKVTEAIDLLVDAGREKEIALSYTPTALNLDQLELLVEFAGSKGIEHVHISLLEVRGRARTQQELALSDAEKVHLMKTVYTLARQYEGVVTLELSEGTDLIYDTWNFGKNLLAAPLGKTLKFTAEGHVYTSTFVEGNLFWLGTYPDTPLDELLHSPKITELAAAIRERPKQIKECRECIFGPVCCAGVYTLAYNKHRTIWVPDDYCKANQAIFEEVITKVTR
jgi:radical SAM protein with 4Fe4S-binding SPASM domain